jgi:hypothetical protein
VQQDLLDLEVLIAEKAAKVKANLLDVYFEEKRQQYFEEFVNAKDEDVYDLHMKVRVLNEMIDDINAMIEGGRIAQLTTGE